MGEQEVAPEIGEMLSALASSEAALDELEVARRVHDVLELHALTRESPSKRFIQAAAFMQMPAPKIRRYYCLHIAPPEVKTAFVQGRITARIVEQLQALVPANQLVLLRRILDTVGPDEVAYSAGGMIARETQKYGNTGQKNWTELAVGFEASLRKAMGLIDEYVDAPHARLMEVLKGAGGMLGRRSLLAVIDEQIGLLTTLKQTLERGLQKGQTNGSAAVAR